MGSFIPRVRVVNIVKTVATVANSALVASGSDKPMENFAKDMAVEAFGNGVGKKLDSLTKNVNVNDTVKDLLNTTATNGAKTVFEEKVDEKKQ